MTDMLTEHGIQYRPGRRLVLIDPTLHAGDGDAGHGV
jgi:hypothetical protein